jgi:glycosyltransferase involved in cell wall biosynthesis
MTDPAPQISVVLPAHNEEGNVAAMAQRLSAILGALGTYEIVFIDDRSTDDTLDAIRALARADKRVRFVSFARNFGHQVALRAGLRHARGAAVILMDCDFEHPPELIPELIARWREGAKVVVTQRNSPSEATSFAKRATSQLYYRLFKSLSDIPIEPGSADFLLLDRAAVDAVNSFDNHDVFLRGLVRWIGLPLATVTYTQGTRSSGESSYTLGRMIDLAVVGIVSHSIRPLRVAIYLALLFAFAAFLLFVYSIVSFLWIGHTVAGWTSIMSAIATLGAGQFLVLGIIGEYVGRVLRETRRWPLYLIAETETSSQGAGSDEPPGNIHRLPGSSA